MPAAMPTDHTALIAVSSRSRRRSDTQPMTVAESSAAKSAPYSGLSQVQPQATLK